MTHPTQRIIDLLKIRLIKEGERHECFDDGGVETEVGEFLYGLVRMTKPERILETGLYSAISCMYMAAAVKDNEFGHIDTVEYEQEHIKRSKRRLIDTGLEKHVTVYQQDAREFVTSYMYDFMFLDTEPQIRFQELIKFYPSLKPGGFVFIHDLPRDMCQGNVNPDHPEIESWPWGNLPEEIKALVVSRDLTPWMFDTPRGLVGFYKKHKKDYL